MQALTVNQIKKVQELIEEANERSNVEMKECEEERLKNLVMIGNLLEKSVPVSNDEVGRGVCVHACVCACACVCVHMHKCAGL